MTDNMARPNLRKTLEKFPDDFGAVDIAVLRAEQQADDAGKTHVRGFAGHAVAAMIDAVEHDIAALRAGRLDARHTGRVRLVAMRKLGHGGIARFAAVEAPPEREGFLGRPESGDRKAAGAAAP